MAIPKAIYFGLINGALLVTALIVWLRRPVRAFFAARATALRKAIEGAQAARAQATARAREYGERLDRIEAELQALREAFRAEGEAERAAIVRQAEAHAVKLTADTERMMTHEVKRAKEQLRATTVDLAIMMAERYLREQITTDDQVRLARRYIERLGQLQ